MQTFDLTVKKNTPEKVVGLSNYCSLLGILDRWI